MIRTTLQRTKKATYAILGPSPIPEHQGMPTPMGTGFFIHGSGLFLTAHHVVATITHIEQVHLLQSPGEDGWGTPMLQWPAVAREWPEFDLALLQVDFSRNASKAHLQGLEAFDYIEVDVGPQQEGQPAYSFGYPLPQTPAPVSLPGGVMMGHVGLGPRTTSAIISSTVEHTKMVDTAGDARVYVLDKALNYGNSGGPVIASETGKAFGVCARFQPVFIPQPSGAAVMIPSLYGIAISVGNVASELRSMIDYLNDG